MVRAKSWTPDVENNFRFQCAGWRSREEYLCSDYPDPESWPEGFVSKLQIKANGYFMYFKRHRECVDKWLPRVKIYKYADDAEGKEMDRREEIGCK